MTGRDARILEAGYRAYEGRRLGPRHATWALTRHSFERIMGLKRPARYKILPFVVLAIAYLPAIAFIGIVALVPRTQTRTLEFIPSPGRYYFFITAAIVLFAVVAAPEALCPDRRSGFLGIYLASPLTRSTYLLAKAMAVVGALLLVTLGPPLLLLIGLALQNDGPRSVVAFLGTLVQIFVAGVCLSLLYGSLSLAMPSLTDRRAFAAAGTLLLLLGSTVLGGILTFGLRFSDNFLLLALNRLPLEVALRIFTLRGLPTPSLTPLPTAGVVTVAVTVTVAAGALTWARMSSTQVTR